MAAPLYRNIWDHTFDREQMQLSVIVVTILASEDQRALCNLGPVVSRASSNLHHYPADEKGNTWS